MRKVLLCNFQHKDFPSLILSVKDLLYVLLSVTTVISLGRSNFMSQCRPHSFSYEGCLYELCYLFFLTLIVELSLVGDVVCCLMMMMMVTHS